MTRQGRWSTLGPLVFHAALCAALPVPAGQVLLHFVPSPFCPQAQVDVRTIEGSLEVQHAVVTLRPQTWIKAPRTGALKLSILCARGDLALGGRDVVWSGQWPTRVTVGGKLTPGMRARGGTDAWGHAPLVASR